MSTVLKFEKNDKCKSCFEPVLDKDGKRIPCFFRSKLTGVIFYRKSFARLGIPPIFQTTEESTMGRARTKADLMVQRHKNRHLGVDDSMAFGRVVTKTFKQVAEEVLLHYTPKQRVRTQRKHKDYVALLIDIFGPLDINSISVKAFEVEIAHLKAQGKRETFFDYSKHMNLIMRYAYNQKYATHLLRFPNPDDGRSRAGRRYKTEEIKTLWENASDDVKDQLILAYENVMRLREMLGLSYEPVEVMRGGEVVVFPWVDLKTGQVTISKEFAKTGSKTGRGRSFFLSPGALKRLKQRYENRQTNTPWVFPSPKDPRKPADSNHTSWANLKANAAITGDSARWHDLRHTGLTVMLLEKRLNPLAVSEFAGVSMATIQRVYLKPEARHTADVGRAVKIGE